jgi:aldehyde:ferredoxin oxidoreductase
VKLWKGQVAKINLTTRSIKIDVLPNQVLSNFLGGRGLALKLYVDNIDPQIEPLDEKNKVVIASGALCGTGAPAASIASVLTKSPLTKTVCYGRVLGHFGTELKFCGFDALIIEGRAEYPVIISISNVNISIKPALEYWGYGTFKTEGLIKESLKDKWRARESCVLSIGQAGENKVNLATLVSDGLLIEGGAGIGAIFGAKNLKAMLLMVARM